jgi:hypothetical protein
MITPAESRRDELTGSGSVLAMARSEGALNRRPRCGFTLVEVAVAAAILFASLAVLSQLAFVGRRHLDKAEQLAVASRLCENELARLVSGIEPIDAVDSRPLLEDTRWECRIELAPIEEFDLWELSVGVRLFVEDSQLSPEADLRPWFRLVQWIPSTRLPLDLQRESAADQRDPGSAPTPRSRQVSRP